jgi:hypothetical protein
MIEHKDMKPMIIMAPAYNNLHDDASSDFSLALELLIFITMS